MAKKKKVERTAAEVAMNLLDLRSQINLWKKDEKDLSDVLKKMIRAGEKQDIYKLRKDYTLAIKDKELAFKWASEHNCLKVDTPLVDALIKRDRAALPDGFALKESEKLVEAKEKEIAEEEFIIS